MACHRDLLRLTRSVLWKGYDAQECDAPAPQLSHGGEGERGRRQVRGGCDSRAVGDGGGGEKRGAAECNAMAAVARRPGTTPPDLTLGGRSDRGCGDIGTHARGESTTSSGCFAAMVVLVERRDARVRRVCNADEVQEALARECEARGIELVVAECEHLSVPEQMRLFRRCDAVIGMHGAGLANIIFCRPGTHVVELLPVQPPSIRHVFWHLAASLELDYIAYPLGGARWSSERVVVDANHLARFVASVGALDPVGRPPE